MLEMVDLNKKDVEMTDEWIKYWFDFETCQLLYLRVEETCPVVGWSVTTASLIFAASFSEKIVVNLVLSDQVKPVSKL